MKYSRNDRYLKALGNRIRELRVAKNLSQADLAYSVNFEISQISRIERGVTNTSISNLYEISVALDIPLKKIVDFDL